MAMTGDLISSFVKRRMGLAPSDRVTGVDQIPESVLPLLACIIFLPLTSLDVIAIGLIFFLENWCCLGFCSNCTSASALTNKGQASGIPAEQRTWYLSEANGPVFDEAN